MLRFVRRELFNEPGRAPKPDIYQINRKIADSGDRTRAAFETGALGRGRYQLRHARVVEIFHVFLPLALRQCVRCQLFTLLQTRTHHVPFSKQTENGDVGYRTRVTRTSFLCRHQLRHARVTYRFSLLNTRLVRNIEVGRTRISVKELKPSYTVNIK